MRHKKGKNGSSVVEVIVALGVLVVVLTGIAVLYTNAINGTENANKQFQAEMYLNQGLEAVRAIRDNDFNNLTIATHGLTDANGYWEFLGASDTWEEFIRTVEIAEVQRSDVCDIVTTGGVVDPDSKKITITIAWDEGMTSEGTVSASQYLHNWDYADRCLDEADDVNISIGQVHMSLNNKKLMDLSLENKGAQDVIIDSITITWTTGSTIDWVVINQETVWQYHGGIGSPQGKQPSGTLLDIVDYTIPRGETHWIKEIKFTESVENSTFLIAIRMSDGSAVHAYIEPYE
jgi:type II secretory pathway pseudopilin PulG